MSTPNQKDYSKCTHYPWFLIDDECQNCIDFVNKKDNNTFYCISCDDFTRHRKKYGNRISCIACNTIKKYIAMQNPNTNHELCLYMMPNSNIPKGMLNNFFGEKCQNCNSVNAVEFLNAYFHCTIDGIEGACVDTHRPLCSRCHYKICNKKSHESCTDKIKLPKNII